MNHVWTAVGVLGALALVLSLLLPAGMLVLLRSPPSLGGTTTPEDLGLDHETVRLETQDGVELAAWIVPATNESASAIVVAHGYPASKADVLPLVAPLAEDHHLVLVDQRGLGDSEGTTTLGIREPLDVQAGIEAAREIQGVERVGLIGFSMGAAAAIQAAASTPVDAVLAQAAYADLETLAPSVFDGLGPLADPAGHLLLAYARLTGLDPSQARPVDAIGDVGAPVLLVHGTEDETIPADHSRRLASQSPDAKLCLVEEAAHGEAGTHPEYVPRLRAFFDENLDA